MTATVSDPHDDASGDDVTGEKHANAEADPCVLAAEPSAQFLAAGVVEPIAGGDQKGYAFAVFGAAAGSMKA